MKARKPFGKDEDENKKLVMHRVHQDRYYERTYAMQPPSDQTVTAIRRALASGKRILLAGGPSGAYTQKIMRDDRFIHLVSTESGHNRVDASVIPGHVGVVLLTKYLSARLMDNLLSQCKTRNLQNFGPFKSIGSVQRAVEMALALGVNPAGYTEKDDEADVNAALAKVDAAVLGQPPAHTNGYTTPRSPISSPLKAPDVLTPSFAAPAPLPKPQEAPAPRSAAAPTVADIEAVFEDAFAALSLAKETSIKALQAAGDSVKATEQLAKLRELLK